MAPNLFYLFTRISAEWTLTTYALNKLYRVKYILVCHDK